MFENDDTSVFDVFPQTRSRSGYKIWWKPIMAALALTGLAATASGQAHSRTGQTAPSSELSHKGDRFLNQPISPKSSSFVSVIVKLDGGCTPANAAQLVRLGATITARYEALDSAAVRLPARNLVRLAALPVVRHLSSDTPVRKFDEFTVEGSQSQNVFQQYGVTGQGVTVAILDSGIHNTADFGNPTILGLPKPLGGSRLLAQVNFVPDDKGNVNTGAFDDKCGHGTHIAGIIAGNAQMSSDLTCYRTFKGIAIQSGLINVRVLDQNGQSTVSTVLNGLNWIYTNRTKYKIRVINLSMGHPVGESYTTDPLCQMVEKLWKSGIVVVCAAGNSGRQQDTNNPALNNEGYGAAYGSIQSPGNDPYIITVGAMKATSMTFSTDGTHTYNRSTDRIATYSSRGPSRLDFVIKPDIVAPGNKVISTVADGSALDNYAGNTNDIRQSEYRLSLKNDYSKAYFRLSGTSMAAPVVAGAAALMLHADATLTPDTIKARLMLSADKWTHPDGSSDPCTFGAGYLNVAAALASKATVPAAMSALSPSLSIDDAGNVFVNMDRVLWGTDAVNGARVLWGVSGVYDFRVLWGDRVLWGTSDNILDASRVLWGTGVWGDRVLWGTNSSAVDLTSTAINGE